MRARLLLAVLVGLIVPACTTFTSDGPPEPDAGGADAAPDANERDASVDGDAPLPLGEEIAVSAPTEIILGDGPDGDILIATEGSNIYRWAPGATSTTIAVTGVPAAHDLRVASGKVWFVSNGALASASLGGGPTGSTPCKPGVRAATSFGPNVVMFATTGNLRATGRDCVDDIPVTNGRVDLLDSDGTSIFRFEPSIGGGKLSSCDVAEVSCGASSVVLGMDLGSVVALAHDDSRVAWASDSTVSTVLKTGKGVKTLAMNQKLPKALAASGGFIYWTNYDEGTVRRAPEAGGEVTLVREGLDHPWGLVVTATDVIVASSAGNRVSRFPKP